MLGEIVVVVVLGWVVVLVVGGGNVVQMVGSVEEAARGCVPVRSQVAAAAGAVLK